MRNDYDDEDYLNYMSTSAFDESCVLQSQLSYIHEAISHSSKFKSSMGKISEVADRIQKDLKEFQSLIRPRINRKQYGIPVTRVVPYPKLSSKFILKEISNR